MLLDKPGSEDGFANATLLTKIYVAAPTGTNDWNGEPRAPWP